MRRTLVSTLVFFTLLTFGASAHAQECQPQCRSGYVCIKGACVSACNPPCGAGERCENGDCVQQTSPASPPPTAAPPTAPPPTAPPPTAPPSTAPAPSAPPPTAAPPAPPPPATTPAPFTPPPAPPSQQQPHGVRTHDGFYLRLALGFGLTSGTSKDPGLSESVDISGLGVLSEFAMGGTVAPGLVIGGGVYSGVIPSPTYKAFGTETKGGLANGGIVGPMIDYYFNPEGGFHVQGAVGLASISAGAGSDTPKYPSQDVSGSGAGFMLGAGYETWVGEQWSFGGLVRLLSVSAKVASSDCNSDSCRADVSLLVPGVLATLTYH